jgi:D-xylose transport system permease protein
MTKGQNMSKSTNSPQLDRADTRVRRDEGMAGAIRAFLDRVRSGDLGMLPVFVGLIMISIVFSSLNPIFLAPINLANLLFDAAAVGFIALGVVCVLLLGEIDLSIGSMSGLASALVGVLWVNVGLPLPVAILGALVSGAFVGLLYGFMRNSFEMPSFVATLAGLLALLGMQLYILGSSGSINLPFTSPMVRFGQLMIIPSWLSYLLAILPGSMLIVGGITTMRRRSAANLSSTGLSVVMVKAAALTAALLFAVFYLELGRGVPWMFGIFVLFVVIMDYAFTRTKWGRSMFAVGGNAEAARRSGINVNRIRLSAFVLCSTFAAFGGVFSASRLASSSIQAGTGDVNLNAIAAGVIGGTSLFGGRGSAWSALLGVLVIQAISNGLTLLNLSSSLRFMITGGVLAIAVIVDSLARRSRASHGRA